MATPNIVNVTTINGNTQVLSVSTTATAIANNQPVSNQIFKVNALYISNQTANTASVNVDIYRATVAYPIATTVIVPNNSVLDVISKSVYLMEGDALRLTASNNSTLTGVCSFEVIS
jgi:hypothetical protein